MAGIMRVLLGALPFLLPTFFFPSLSLFFLFTIYFSHELARMLSPPSLSRPPSIRPIVACTLDQGRIYFTFLFLSLSLSGSWREHLRAFIRIVQRTDRCISERCVKRSVSNFDQIPFPRLIIYISIRFSYITYIVGELLTFLFLIRRGRIIIDRFDRL